MQGHTILLEQEQEKEQEQQQQQRERQQQILSTDHFNSQDPFFVQRYT